MLIFTDPSPPLPRKSMVCTLVKILTFMDGPLNSDAIQVLIFCLLHTKYYIYIQRLFHGNKLNLYSCLAQLKFGLEIEYNICKSTKN